jgi:hypothetical protein
LRLRFSSSSTRIRVRQSPGRNLMGLLTNQISSEIQSWTGWRSWRPRLQCKPGKQQTQTNVGRDGSVRLDGWSRFDQFSLKTETICCPANIWDFHLSTNVHSLKIESLCSEHKACHNQLIRIFLSGSAHLSLSMVTVESRHLVCKRVLTDQKQRA